MQQNGGEVDTTFLALSNFFCHEARQWNQNFIVEVTSVAKIDKVQYFPAKARSLPCFDTRNPELAELIYAMQQSWRSEFWPWQWQFVGQNRLLAHMAYQNGYHRFTSLVQLALLARQLGKKLPITIYPGYPQDILLLGLLGSLWTEKVVELAPELIYHFRINPTGMTNRQVFEALRHKLDSFDYKVGINPLKFRLTSRFGHQLPQDIPLMLEILGDLIVEIGFRTGRDLESTTDGTRALLENDSSHSDLKLLKQVTKALRGRTVRRIIKVPVAQLAEYANKPIERLRAAELGQYYAAMRLTLANL